MPLSAHERDVAVGTASPGTDVGGSAALAPPTGLLRVGVNYPALRPGAVDFAREAERLGADSVWTAEFWAGDAFTPLAHLAARSSTIRLGTAIAQLGARSPAMLAMTAQSVQALAGDRFVLGIGASGPQVVEGWHGVPFARPVRRTRETIEILRTITAGERLSHTGEVYPLPLPGGEGRPIRSLVPPRHLPIHVAALGPANLRLTGELADGWIGTGFLPESAAVFLDPLRQGAERVGRSLADLELSVAVGVELTDHVEAAGRRHAAGYAFTIGAMGSAGTNFYNDAFERQGFGDDVREVQRLWLAGDREAARQRVPVAIGLRTNLVGTDEMVLERLRLYRAAGITTLRAGFAGDPSPGLDRQLVDLEHLLGLVAQVNAEPTPA